MHSAFRGVGAMIATMRRRVPYRIAVPAAAAASFLAHAVARVPPGPVDPDGDGLEHAAGGLGLLPLLIGVLGAALGLAAVARFRRRPAAVTAGWFAAFPAFAYLLQESAERALHSQLFGFPAGIEPALVVVAVIHAAFGLVAFLLVRAVQAVVRRSLAGAGRRTLPVGAATFAVPGAATAALRCLPFVRDGPARAPPLFDTA
jgi:hypothetical protein